MDWEVFQLKGTDGRSAPFVSIGRGAIDFSQSACKLINDNGDYKFAQILIKREGMKTLIAVKFLKEYEDNCIQITRKKDKNGKQIAGMTVRNKDAIERLFGKDSSNNGVVRHKVEPIDKNTLRILD